VRLFAFALALLLALPATARVTRFEITADVAAFGGQGFGDIGGYRHLTGTIHGEVDPADPANAVIQDLWLAPRNASGKVEYTTEVELLAPADQARGNGVLLQEVVNRGNKLAVALFDRAVGGDRNALASAGDGLLFREGYTLIWFGWQQDLIEGGGRLRMTPVVARNQDGSPITGIVRSELAVNAAASELPLGAGLRSGTIHTGYPTASMDNGAPFADGFVPTLTMRAREQAPRVPVANAEWRFGGCAGAADPTLICMPGKFQPGVLYELIYRARDPLVGGLGFAAARDIGAFFARARDGNPVYREGQAAILEGTSQSGRFIRSFLQLGFNEAEGGGRVFDGALVHVGAGLLPLNLRFGQPGRAWGEQIDHLYPGYDFPFSYLRQTDPLSGRTEGVLDRCQASQTCPRIFHVATALEFWEGRQSLALTDPLGRADLPEIGNVRTYMMASTQHSPAPSPPPFGACQQQANPMPQSETMRALLIGLTRWVREGVPPPHSVIPRIADDTLVAPDVVHLPPIPANHYGGTARPALFAGVPPANPLHLLYRGKRYDPASTSGIADIEPPLTLAGQYGVLVPQVDADGNDIAGIRAVGVQVPVGTYTGWNLGRDGLFSNGSCNLTGSFVPFAATKAEREAAGDTRLSLAERYPNPQIYLFRINAAVKLLNEQQFLLFEDAERILAAAKAAAPGIAPDTNQGKAP
jgi:hypothetical protein